MKFKFKYIFYFLGLAVLISACQEENIEYDGYATTVDSSKSVAAATGNVNKVSASYVVISGLSVIEDVVDRGYLISEDESFLSFIVVPATDNTVEEYSVRIANLKGITKYYFKAYTTTIEGGSSFGEVKNFTTREGVVGFTTDDYDDWAEIGFTSIDKDGDGFDWKPVTGAEDDIITSYVSASWSGSALTPENYLLFPAIDLDGVDGALTFSIQAGDPDWPEETIIVLVSSEPITEANCRDAQKIFSHTLAGGDVYTGVADIPAVYEGAPVYLALLHAESSDMYNVNFLSASFSFAK